MRVAIAIDAMGGDFGPSEIVPAALRVLKKHPEIHLILVGQTDVLEKALSNSKGYDSERLEIAHASEIVEMDEKPSLALRNKKDSSMRVAIDLVKDEKANACVSAGNTGALMATARFVLKMLPGIDRPAICSALPRINGYNRVLDLGANVDSSSEQLFQFAVMGSELTSAVDHKESPTVALLNVGEEEMKGNDRVKQAASLLQDSHLNYVGFVEGDDLFTGDVDVVVCDGFAGNIALKAGEGVAQFLSHHARQAFKQSIYGRIAAAISSPVLKSLKRKIDPRRYNGASLLGLKGIVVKSHGSADRLSFSHAIQEAIMEIENNVPERIGAQLEQLLTNEDVY